MFSNCCQCCLAQDTILLPSKETFSSHGDGQTLWQYFHAILPSFVQELQTIQYICLRCSKALQVSYHFLQIIKESEQRIVNDRMLNNAKNTELKATTFVVENEFTSDEQGANLKIQFQCEKLSIENQIDETNNTRNKLLIDKGLPKMADSMLNKKTFFCDICNKLFDNSEILLEHNKTIHKEFLPYKCKMCNFYSCYTESLLKHYGKKHNVTEVELNLQQTKELNEIVKENPKFDIFYKCMVCNFESLKHEIVKDHQLESQCVNDETDLVINKFFKCPSCYRSFKDLKSAKIHYTMYHVNLFARKTKVMDHKRQACDKCGKLFAFKSGLLLHKRMCAYRDDVNCSFCDLKFSTVLKYEQHLKSDHEVAIKHECEICTKEFSCSEYLAVHRKRHNERYYQCDLCSKNYINNAELRVHKQRTHNKLIGQLRYAKSNEKLCHRERIYKCGDCNFCTYSKYSLRVHQNIHYGKPYKCPLCAREFVHRQDLRKHCKRLHSINITNEELAVMFKETFGYCSRFDAFSKENNNLEITEMNNLELDKELEEFGLTSGDIMRDLFADDLINYNF